MENRPTEINPFPEMKLFTPLKAVARFIGGISMLPNTADLSLSEHRGASRMLDEALDSQPELPIEGGRWGSLGEY